jgi:hypothetical protein
MGYETQPFELLWEKEGFELRYYPAIMKAKANRNNGFRYLFDFISGNNVKNQKIAMTTPVYMGQQEDESEAFMEFVLPKAYNEANTPAAKSDKVRIYQSEPGYYLAIAFGGFPTEKKELRAQKKLLEFAERNQFKVIGSSNLLVYNSPYKLFNRKNEVLLQIEYKA